MPLFHGKIKARHDVTDELEHCEIVWGFCFLNLSGNVLMTGQITFFYHLFRERQ
jgi:hypothetical protein